MHLFVGRYVRNMGDLESTLNFAFQVLEKKLDRQVGVFNTLQSKVGNLFAFTSALIGGYLSLIVGGQIELSDGSLSALLYLLGLVGLIYVLLCLVCASKTKIFFDPPDTETIYSEAALEMKTEDLKNQVVSDMKESYDRAVGLLEDIAEDYDEALFTLFVSVLVVIIAAVVKSWFRYEQG